MDSAQLHRTSSSPQLPSPLPSARPATDGLDHTFDCDSSEPENSPSRQQKLLSNRNARFPAKKLSITGLSNKLSQLVGNNERLSESKTSPREGEGNGKLHKSKSTGTIGKRSSLGILEEISNTTQDRSARRRADIPIYQDHPERPILQSSPFTSSLYIDPRGDFRPPAVPDDCQDNLGDMRPREFAVDENWSPSSKLASMRVKSRMRSVPPRFDANEYIEHIEKELQQTQEEAYSPLTRRPMKEKLRAANRENDRLQKELAQLRERFETEVKRTVEHKTVTEVELKRRIRDLENSLGEKEHIIRELQYQHEERRVENNIISSLRSSIERLEQDKSDLEAINLSMSKRNEVLTQLLAMSPTKPPAKSPIGSPVREKRNGRPISLILPRQALSPGESQPAMPNSVTCSPRALNSAEISPFRLSPDEDHVLQWSRVSQKSMSTPQQEISDPTGKVQSPLHQTKSRRSTLYSEVSASGPYGLLVSANDEKAPSRRKARRFMGGSHQLKPLLLPALTSESASLPSTSAASSPRSWPFQSPSEADPEDTLLAVQPQESIVNDELALCEDVNATGPDLDQSDGEGPGPAYATRNETASDGFHTAPEFGCSALLVAQVQDHQLLLMTSSHNSNQTGQEDVGTPPRTSRADLSVEHLRQHNSAYSLQGMPMPSTPESIISLPQPLFSTQQDTTTGDGNQVEHFISVGSPFVKPGNLWQVQVRKKRKSSLGPTDLDLMGSQAHHLRQGRHSSTNLPLATSTSRTPRDSVIASPRTSVPVSLKRIPSSDNLADLLRQKNFAARPLAAMTIKTVYTLLSTCSTTLQDFRRDPFALARRVLANAWRMNWKVYGRASWWVLGLFIQPQTGTKARAPIDWDQYDAESIASKYCSSVSNSGESDLVSCTYEMPQPSGLPVENSPSTCSNDEKPGWGRSLYLWGKFSAALILAVGGAVVKGPSEMLKDATPEGRGKDNRQKTRSSDRYREKTALEDQEMQHHCLRVGSRPQGLDGQWNSDSNEFRIVSDLDIRSQLRSSSILEEIQQPDHDSTLRPEAAIRGRVNSLFASTASSDELAARMQDLRLSSTTPESRPRSIHDPEPLLGQDN